MKVSVLLLTVFLLCSAFGADSRLFGNDDERTAGASLQAEQTYDESPIDMIQNMISVLAHNGQSGAIRAAVLSVEDEQVKDLTIKRGIRAACQVDDAELLAFLLDQARGMNISVLQMPRLFQQSLNAAARANNAVVVGSLVDFAVATGVGLEQLKKQMAKTIAIAAELDHCCVVGNLILKLQKMNIDSYEIGEIISNGIEAAARGDHFGVMECLSNNAVRLHVPFASVERGIQQAVRLTSKYNRDKLLFLLINWTRHGGSDREQLKQILSIGLRAATRNESSASFAVLWNSMVEFGFTLQDFVVEIKRVMKLAMKPHGRLIFRDLVLRVIALSDRSITGLGMIFKVLLCNCVRLGLKREAVDLTFLALNSDVSADSLVVNVIDAMLLACKLHQENLVLDFMNLVILKDPNQLLVKKAIQSALGMAVSRGNANLVDYFIKTAMDLNLKFTGFSFDLSLDLNIAVKRGYLDAVRRLFRGMWLMGTTVQQFEYGMYELIYLAATSGNGSMLDFLFNFCINFKIDAVRSWAIKVMHSACQNSLFYTAVVSCIAALRSGISVEELKRILTDCGGSLMARNLISLLSTVPDGDGEVAILKLVHWSASIVGNVAVDFIIGKCLHERDWQRLQLLIEVSQQEDSDVLEMVEMAKYCLMGVDEETGHGKVKMMIPSPGQGPAAHSLVRQLYVKPDIYGFRHLKSHSALFAKALRPAVEEFQALQFN